MEEGWTWGESRGRCMGLDGGPKVRGGGGGPIPGIMGFGRGLLGPGGRRKGGRICCIIWCSIKRGSGIGPRGVITIGGLPLDTIPIGG